MDYSSQLYGWVFAPGSSTGGNSTDLRLRTDYVLVQADGLERPTTALLWRFFEPSGKHVEGINMNTRLQRVYDDGSVWLYDVP